MMTTDVIEVTEASLDPENKALWAKAQSAYKVRNFPYAVSLCHAVLKDHPGFLDARKLARTSSSSDQAGKKQKKGLFGGSGLKLPSIKKDPVKALYEIELELAKSPFDPDGNDLLHECAKSLNLLGTAAFALETVRSGAPENKKLIHKLAEFYLANENPAKAAEAYNTICEQDPTDMAALKGSKDSTARASMKKQNWEGATDVRDLMKDADQAAELEDANRAAMTKEQMQEKLAKLSAEYAADNQNVELVKDIADLYEQLEDWTKAYSFYNYAYSLSSSDVALENKAAEMKDKAAEFEVAQLKAAYEADPNNVELKQQYDTVMSQHTAEQVTEAAARVERNPTDPQLRYELGLALYNSGEYSDAIPHLQQATRNPHIRTKVLLLLGRTFRAKNMHDLAIKQLSDALADLNVMDKTKKEVLYEKGLIHQDMDNKEAALDSFKQIYEVDYGYLDVAKRVEESYS